MPDKQVRFDITVNDDASATIADVGKDVDALEKKSPEIAVTVDDGAATRDLGAFIKKLEGVDGDTATVVLAVKAADVQRQLQDTLADVARLESSDPLIDVKLAHADDLRGDLETIQTKVRELNGLSVDIDTDPMRSSIGHASADVEGFKAGAVNSAADLAGAFGGELSQSISGIGQGFVGAAEIAGPALASIGISVESLMGPLALVGIAIGGLKFLWDANKKHTEDATKAAKDWSDAIKAANGNLDEAANKKLADILSPAQIQTALDWGLSLQNLVDVANGKVVPAWDAMRASLKEYDRQADLVRRSQSPLNEEQFKALQDSRDHVNDLTTAITGAGQAMHDGAVDADNYRRFTAEASAASADLARNQDIARQAITDLSGEMTLAASKKTQLDLEVDAGEWQRVLDQVEILRRNNVINLQIIAKGGAGFGSGFGGGATPSMVPSSVVNVNMPRGSNGVDVVRQIAGQTRRNGRRYGAQVVNFARR